MIIKQISIFVENKKGRLAEITETLSNAGITVADTEDTYAPITTVELTDPDHIKNMTKLVEMLEDDDDVQDVYHNWDMPEDLE